jgi:hypothetical protein
MTKRGPGLQDPQLRRGPHGTQLTELLWHAPTSVRASERLPAQILLKPNPSLLERTGKPGRV